jgi:hypothetical protein
MASAGKVMLTMFWDSLGVVLANFQKRGENVNSASYCEVRSKLQDAIHRKRLGQLARGVLLHHDIATPHTAQQPRREFKNYSGNFLNIHLTAWTWLLVTSICLVRWKATFVANVSVITKTLKRRWLRQQSKDFYTVGFNRLVKRWGKCINVSEGYVEK